MDDWIGWLDVIGWSLQCKDDETLRAKAKAIIEDYQEKKKVCTLSTHVHVHTAAAAGLYMKSCCRVFRAFEKPWPKFRVS